MELERFAILSDIHGNSLALEAVLQDILERDELAELLGHVDHGDPHLRSLLLRSKQAHREHGAERDQREHDRRRVCAGGVEVLDLGAHV